MEEEIQAGFGNQKAKLARMKKKFMFKKKVDISDNRSRFNRLQMILRLRILEGPLYIYAQLERLALSKQLIALKLETDVECDIPPELGQKHLPLAF